MTPSERVPKDREDPRLTMVNCQLRPHGIGEARLIQAFREIPREDFVPPALQPLAYADVNLPLTQDPDPKRWLLAPLTLGKLLQCATIQSMDRVLVVGCGSGYSLALIARVATVVVGVESHEGLATHARQYGAAQEIPNIQVVVGALSVGYPKNAPYDVILVEGAVHKVPLILTQQLSPHGGRLVTIVKEQNELGKGVLIARTDNTLDQTVKFDASCPYLPEFEPMGGFQL